jgi:LDH2 family malate/lactate/ureidoglycolate dehydrogenase
MNSWAQPPMRVASDALELFCEQALVASGAGKDTAAAATRAMMHASRLGVDSHGVRLLAHYVKAIEGGRVNGKAKPRFIREFGATAVLDADNAHGALATYTAMERAAELARLFGTGSVAIRNSSHFGAAGAYALQAAEQGLIGLSVCNSDAIVRLHGGATKFHGTNPIAFAVPVQNEKPWLLDLATSAIPFNRVILYRSLGIKLPAEVASDAGGSDTEDPTAAQMLAPLGGDYGYKGAGLAGMVEILSSVITGMGLSFELTSMVEGEMTQPRHLGSYVAAISPEAFIERDAFDSAMKRYRNALRASPVRDGAKVMAPGDREWAEAETRARKGIPIDPETVQAFAGLSTKFGLQPPSQKTGI